MQSGTDPSHAILVHLRSIVTIVLLHILCFNQSSAQLVSSTQRADTTTPGFNFIQFGSTKLASTFLFSADADYQAMLGSGLLNLRQMYRGSTIRTASSTFRDDEALALSYRYTTWTHLQPVAQTDIQISRDSRAVGLSSLTRYNLGLGARVLADSSRWFEVQAGAESNKLLGIQDAGSLLRLSGMAQDVDLEQFHLTSRLRSEFSIFPRRTNGDVDLALHFARDIDAHNALHLNVAYRSLNRDWYSILSTSGTENTVIESRLEQRLGMDADLRFGIVSNLVAEVQLGFSQGDIDRQFKDFVVGVAATAATRRLSEISFNANAMVVWKTDHQRHELSLIASTRDEQNSASRHFDSLTTLQLDTIQLQERIRDNSMSRTQLSLRSLWELSRRDTLSLQATSSMLRYDTPSTANDDDRDELNELISLSFGHRFNEGFRASLTSRVQLTHLVYLRAQRSAMNSWNRIIQLSPSAEWHSSFIHMNPVFEVLAQYSVYDFEGKAGVPTSFSFRQVSYRDSISIPLATSTFADLRVYFRQFERAELYWSSFAELPQSRNFEQYCKVLANYAPESSVLIGAGGRWYALSQQSLIQRDAVNNLSQSFGPECVFQYTLNSATRLVFNAWYEFQYLNHVHTRNVPNMMLMLRRAL